MENHSYNEQEGEDGVQGLPLRLCQQDETPILPVGYPAGRRDIQDKTSHGNDYAAQSDIEAREGFRVESLLLAHYLPYCNASLI